MPFMRGARPTPRHVLAAAPKFAMVSAPLAQFGVVPPKLDMWGNDQYGDCVSAEEAAAKAWWSVYCGLPETFATAAEVIAFARKHGWLNGADLTSPMDAMKAEGMSISGKVYTDGGYYSVDYSNELVLQASIDPTDGNGGPSKIGIDANALPQGAGNQMGWYSTRKGNFPNEDHCVSLFGYGRADYLYDLMKVKVPSALAPSTPGYLLYTWSTVGFVTHDWLMGTCAEAWTRNPTTPGQSPSPTPDPGPGPTPPPTPDPSTLNLPTAGGISFQMNTPWVKSGGKFVSSGVCSMSVSQATPIPVPRELAGKGAPVWILILAQWLGTKAIPIIQADLAAGKTWGQIGIDLLLSLLGPQANVTPRQAARILDRTFGGVAS